MKTGDELAIAYAENRIAVSNLDKQIKFLTNWQRSDKGIDLSGVRDEYLESGDRWRGWTHAIANIDYSETVTPEQHELASLLDAKAKRRVDLGNIKRQIYSLGRALQVKS